MALKFGYWKIRGLGAAGRMMFAYAGLEVEDTQYTLETIGDWHGKDKPALAAKNPLANLPYVIDGDKVITQSNSVLSYIARKAGLGAKNDEEQTLVEQLLADIYDLRDLFVQSVYWYKKVVRTVGEWNELTPIYFEEKAAPFYNKYEAWLTKAGTPFLVGASPTAPDFHLWELLDQHELFAKDIGKPSPLETRPKLKAFYESFRALDKLQGYFASEAYKLPANVVGLAFWGAPGAGVPEGAPQ